MVPVLSRPISVSIHLSLFRDHMFKKLFSWVKSKFTTTSGKEGDRKQEPDSDDDDDYRFDVYIPGERIIYQYWDGEKLVRADPMTIYKKVMGKSKELLDAIKTDNPETFAANHDRRVNAIKEVFGVKSLDEKGLSELEMAELLNHFLDYCVLIKRDAPNLTSHPPKATPTPSPGPVVKENIPETPKTTEPLLAQ